MLIALKTPYALVFNIATKLSEENYLDHPITDMKVVTTTKLCEGNNLDHAITDE
jgi:hypothetical protein